MPHVSVFLAISDPLQRALLVRALRRHGDLTVVGTEQDGCRALDAIVRDGPDVAVIEAGLPTLDGLALCRRLAQARPEVGTRVLLLDGARPLTRDRAVASGAAGCVPATATSAELCDAVASIANGGTIFYN